MGFFLLALALLFALLYWFKSTRTPLPPDAGSLAGLTGHRWEIYAERSRILGPLISVSHFGTSIVIVNTRKAILDLLDKRKTYASRPRWPMAELLGRQNNVGFTYYGKRLKDFRKALHKSLIPTVILECWNHLLHEQSRELCQSLLANPDGFRDIVEGNIQEFIVILTYGHRPHADHLRLAQMVAQHTGEALQPARWMVNMFPACIWFPGAGFLDWANEGKELFLKLTRTPFYAAKAELKSGRKRVSFVHNSLDDLGDEHSAEEEDIIMFAAGSLLSAGTETMTSVFLSFLGTVVNHPRVQKRAHEEILDVVGSEELPCLRHRDDLPYIDCIIKEVHRSYPAVPMVTRSNEEQDVYEGFRIPQNSWVMGNVWAVLHDENTYNEPDKFIPERFESSPYGKSAPDPREFVYGFGRRRCPGVHLADLYLFLMVARVLAVYEIVPLTPADPPHLEFAASFAMLPKPFKCKFIPRKNAVRIISQGGPK
ncbi:O-methylsterigmatocystin oxidoreductase [Termitomyces sp. T112]|nr:O-methylsterigmatocystin oxidoreductase [Termitomyces sp. T112]